MDLSKDIKALNELYLRKALGDCYVTSKKDSIKIDSIESKDDFLTQVKHCKLCDLSKLVKDNERFCGFYPAMESSNKDSIKIAFIVESIQLKLDFLQDSNIINYDLKNIAQNKTNEMLLNIITNVFNLESNFVYILPRFKCADIGANQNLSYKIRTQNLENERKICSNYLINQLKNIDYAVFFGENLCNDFFLLNLKSAQGKLLEYAHTTAICVPELMQMLANPSLKKSALSSFNLLKNFISHSHRLF